MTNEATPKATADRPEATALMTRTRSIGRGRVTSRCAAGLALIALGLGGCATSPPVPPRVDYLAPSGVAPAARSAVVQQPPDLLLGAIVDWLQQGPFTITELDEQAGFVVARYSGDPEPYVDCGWIVTYDTGALERIPAATAGASFDRMIERDPTTMDRQLRLDARMVVSLAPRGAGTVVSTSTTYVLTKMIDVAGPGGTARGQARETISFETGESGTFAKGTLCQPNGRFERVVLDSLPATSFVAQSVPPATAAARDEPEEPATAAATREEPEEPAPLAPPAPVLAETRPEPTSQADPIDAPQEPETPVAPPVPAAEPIDPATLEARIDAVTDGMPCGATVEAELGEGNSVRLSGYVDSEQDAARLRQALNGLAGMGAVESALEIQPWPFCAILQVIDPYRSPDRERGLVITTPDRQTLLSEGDALTLDIFLPPDAEYLYLGYVQTDGRVGYITVLPVRQYVQDTGAIRFETGYQISAPFGREMIVAVTSARPLFDQALPAYQPPEEYVAMLGERLAAVRAADRDAALDASHLVLSTQPEPAF